MNDGEFEIFVRFVLPCVVIVVALLLLAGMV